MKRMVCGSWLPFSGPGPVCVCVCVGVGVGVCVCVCVTPNNSMKAPTARFNRVPIANCQLPHLGGDSIHTQLVPAALRFISVFCPSFSLERLRFMGQYGTLLLSVLSAPESGSGSGKSSGALHIRLLRLHMTTDLSLFVPLSTVLPSDACTDACRFTPLPLCCSCRVVRAPSSGGRLCLAGRCTTDCAAPALASSSAVSLYTFLLCR